MEPTEDHTKELARKLYWAISSTLSGLSKQQRSDMFNWASRMADRIITDCHPSLPPTVDNRDSNGYHGQAVGRGGGRNNPSIPRASRPQPPPDLPAWERQQAAMRERAWAHVRGGRCTAQQLPIPGNVYREVGYGSSDSAGSERGGGPSPD